MKIVIETIPHKRQRYETVGDYFYDKDGVLQIRISNMRNDQYAELVIIHELVELILCKAKGVKFSDIDAFDKAFEKRRKPGNTDEPGDDDAAPYRDEHLFATGIEKLLCSKLGINWATYDKKVNSL